MLAKQHMHPTSLGDTPTPPSNQWHHMVGDEMEPGEDLLVTKSRNGGRSGGPGGINKALFGMSWEPKN